MVKTRGITLAFLVTLTLIVAAINFNVHGAALRPLKARGGHKSLQQANLREPVKVLDVLNGDTLLVAYKGQQQVIGLRAVTAPGKNEPGSAEVVTHLRGLLKGKSIEMGFGSSPQIQRDERGRLLVTLFADGENVNQRMRQVTLSRAAQSGPGSSRKAVTELQPNRRSTIAEAPPSNPPIRTKPRPTPLTNSPAIKVYIKPGDKTYHRQGCRELRNSQAVPILLRAEAARLGYKPCPRCKP